MSVCLVPCSALEIGNVGRQFRRVDDLYRRRRQRGLPQQVIFDHETEEQWTRRHHDVGVGLNLCPKSGDVVKEWQLGDGGCVSGVSCGRNHEVVCDTSWQRGLEEGVMRRRASLELLERDGLVAESVHVEVDASVVVENEVADGISALDGECVAIPVVHEPRVFGRDEVASQLVGPQLSKFQLVMSPNSLQPCRCRVKEEAQSAEKRAVPPFGGLSCPVLS